MDIIRNKWVLLGVFIVLALLYFFRGGSDEYPITNFPSTGDNIVAFGDSLVEGVGSAKGGGFVSILSEKIGEPIINLGVAGDTTEDALQRIEKVINSDPKIVMVLLGGNDFIQRKNVDQTFKNLESIVTQIQNTGSIVIILGVQGGVIRDKYDDEFRAVARRTGSAYVNNVLDGIFREPHLMFDGIHPNDRGYEIIADKILPTLRSLNK